LKSALDDYARRIWPRKLSDHLGHSSPPRRVAGENADPLGHSSLQIALEQHIGTASAGDYFGVPALMVVGGRCERHQDARTPHGGQFCERRRAGTTKNNLRGV
tara:strand:+ start:460 stop:768 length:309 start_codon:yes stop_codon:yes gene_type:complete